MIESYIKFDDLIKENLPQDSKVTNVYLEEYFGSLCAMVEYTISDEFQRKYELTYKNRILRIRLLQSKQDEGLPVDSFANRR